MSWGSLSQFSPNLQQPMPTMATWSRMAWGFIAARAYDPRSGAARGARERFPGTPQDVTRNPMRAVADLAALLCALLLAGPSIARSHASPDLCRGREGGAGADHDGVRRGVYAKVRANSASIAAWPFGARKRVPVPQKQGCRMSGASSGRHPSPVQRSHGSRS